MFFYFSCGTIRSGVRTVFSVLKARRNLYIRDKFKMDYFAVSMPDMTVFDADMDEKNVVHCYYLMGLGNLGLGKKKEAERYFEKALSLDKNHQNAAIYKKISG